MKLISHFDERNCGGGEAVLMLKFQLRTSLLSERLYMCDKAKRSSSFVSFIDFSSNLIRNFIFFLLRGRKDAREVELLRCWMAEREFFSEKHFCLVRLQTKAAVQVSKQRKFSHRFISARDSRVTRKKASPRLQDYLSLKPKPFLQFEKWICSVSVALSIHCVNPVCLDLFLTLARREA